MQMYGIGLLEVVKRTAQRNVSKFLFANALYSFSTWLISFLSPYIFVNSLYQEFIYLFQTMLFVSSLSTLGLVPALLKYYKHDPDRYEAYLVYAVTVIFSFLLLLGLFCGNPISQFLNIDRYEWGVHFVFYLSVISHLTYIFNRAVRTAKEEYSKLFSDICLVFMVRIGVLGALMLWGITHLAASLAFICILPMTADLVHYLRTLWKPRPLQRQQLMEFLLFALTTSVIGIIYNTTNRLYLLRIKEVSDTIAALICYSGGMLGVITIFNTTFTSYFIGKLDERNVEGMNRYCSKLKRMLLPYVLCAGFCALLLFGIVYYAYPYDKLLAATYSVVLFGGAASISYIGLVTLMTKTLNLLREQLAINVVCFVCTYLVVHLSVEVESFRVFVIAVCLPVLFEVLLAGIVLRRLHRL